MNRWPILLAPTALVAAVVLATFASVPSSWTVMLRPWFVASVIATLCALVLAMVTRRPLSASAVVCGVILLLYDPLLGTVAVVAGTLLVVFRSRLGLSRAFTRTAFVTAVGTLLIVNVVRVATDGSVTLGEFRMGSPVRSAEDAAGPNVYLLLLDGYPRADTLANDFAYDNQPFLDALSSRGFFVNPDARTAFTNTELTLASTQVEDPRVIAAAFPEAIEVIDLRREVRRTLLVNTPAMDELRDLGYRLVYVPPPVGFVQWSGWDERDESGALNDFEVHLLQQTLLRGMIGEWIMDQTRQHVDEALEAWSTPTGDGRFVFAHLEAPHPPFLWSPDGDQERPLTCWYERACSLYGAQLESLGISTAEYAERLAPQIDTLNRKVLTAVDRLIERDPGGVVVIFSDHGTRYVEGDSEEAHSTLYAARGTDVTEVDGLFPALIREIGASVAR